MRREVRGNGMGQGGTSIYSMRTSRGVRQGVGGGEKKRKRKRRDKD